MKRESVVSSNVNSIGYNEDSNILEVEFSSGSVYQYYGVPQIEYNSLISAGSHGTYLNQYIKDNYDYKKIT